MATDKSVNLCLAIVLCIKTLYFSVYLLFLLYRLFIICRVYWLNPILLNVAFSCDSVSFYLM